MRVQCVISSTRADMNELGQCFQEIISPLDALQSGTFSDHFSVTWALLLSGTVGEVMVRDVSLSVVTRHPVPQKKAPAFVGQGTQPCRAWIMCSCRRTF